VVSGFGYFLSSSLTRNSEVLYRPCIDEVSVLINPITPLPEAFPGYLQDYCDQASAAIKDHKHHDQRRALLMDFLRKAFGIEVVEIDLEHKVKAASARGRIDAFYRFVIFEVKTDLDRERTDALTELQKYFESQKRPADYVAAVTDGLQFEVFDYDLKTGQPKSIRSFSLEAEAPHLAYEQLDELLAAGRKIPPLAGEVVIRFGSASLTFNRSRQAIRAAFDSVRDLSEVKIKFHEWNALLAKVYGSPPDDEDLFVKHTYLTMVSRAVVTLALFHEVRRETALYRGLMNGEFFRDRNIQNLAEDDFFSWAQGTPAEAVFFEFFGNLFRRLDEFDWSKVDEDLLKTLYQGLVDPDDRQLLGEFYTPDWLAELTLDKIGYKGGTLLDPACGSGTFLFCAIRRPPRSRDEGKQADPDGPRVDCRHRCASCCGTDGKGEHPVGASRGASGLSGRRLPQGLPCGHPHDGGGHQEKSSRGQGGGARARSVLHPAGDA